VTADVSGGIAIEGKEWNNRAKNPCGFMAELSARPCDGKMAKSSAGRRKLKNGERFNTK
jgi:hypothetical protein